MKWAFSVSAIAHIAFSLWLYRPINIPSAQLISISLIQEKIAAKPQTKRLPIDGQNSSGSLPKSIRNYGPVTGSLEETLSQTNYIERIRPLVEAPWLQIVQDRAKLWRYQHRRIQCQTCVKTLINGLGDVLRAVLEETCEADSTLDQGALRAFNGRLYPPPQNLLVGDRLELVWCFRVSPK